MTEDCHAHAGEPHAVGKRAEDAELAAAVGSAIRLFRERREQVGEYAALVAMLSFHGCELLRILAGRIGGRA